MNLGLGRGTDYLGQGWRWLQRLLVGSTTKWNCGSQAGRQEAGPPEMASKGELRDVNRWVAPNAT
jgi:hypothetical protein